MMRKKHNLSSAILRCRYYCYFSEMSLQTGGKANSLMQHDFHSAITSWPTLHICCSTLVNKQGAGGVVTLSKCSCFTPTLNISRFFFPPADNVILCLCTIYAQNGYLYTQIPLSLFSAYYQPLSVHHRRDPNTIICSFTTTVNDIQFITVKEQCFYTGQDV